MPTPSGHTKAIRATRVIGTTVYDASGDRIGEIEDIILDKTSNNIMFAALGFGGVLGMGEKFNPIPWSMLDYDPDKNGFVVKASKDQLKQAPSDSLGDLTEGDGIPARNACYQFFGTQQYW